MKNTKRIRSRKNARRYPTPAYASKAKATAKKSDFWVMVFCMALVVAVYLYGLIVSTGGR